MNNLARKAPVPRSSESLAPMLIPAERLRIVRTLDGIGISSRSFRGEWTEEFQNKNKGYQILFLRREDREKAQGSQKEREEISLLLEDAEKNMEERKRDPFYQTENNVITLAPRKVPMSDIKNDLLYADNLSEDECEFIRNLRGFRKIDANGRKLDPDAREAIFHGQRITRNLHHYFPFLKPMNGFLEGHSTTVAIMASLLAKEMNEQEGKVLIQPYQAALGGFFHDIGKLERGINELTKKPGKFTTKEYEVAKLHSTIGVTLWDEMIEKRHPLLSKLDDETKLIIHNAIQDHHERPDGKGYTGKLDSSLIGELLAPVDTNDAICFKRAYDQRKGDRNEMARRILQENSGTQFSERMTNILLEMDVRLIDSRKEDQEEE